MKVPSGFQLSSIHCGIKRNKLDLGLIYCKSNSCAIGFFTTSANPSYSVTFSKKNVNNPVRAILVNSGNANCFSHKQGLKDTEKIALKLAKLLKVKKTNILFASTGIIGKKLPKEKIIKGFPELIKKQGIDLKGFSKSILTTDAFAKVASAQLAFGKRKINILGFAKGAGMIAPDLATMLGFVISDVKLGSSQFKNIAKSAIEESFNSITVDGCMSTNDSVFFLNSNKVALKSKREIDLFSKKIKGVCLDLAKMIVSDAEGATKFIEVVVKGAKTKTEAKKAGLFIANSNLFKTAVYGENPNWGRIIAGLGAAGVKVKENVSIKADSLKRKKIKIIINLKRGNFNWTVYTCDLTPKYIKINAEYS